MSGEEVPIYAAMSRVMADVGAVRKGDRNQAQGFSFRGVDAVVNAVSPILRKHGVVVMPTAVEATHGSVEVGKNRTPMGHVVVKVTYLFTGPKGDSLTACAVGEAMDSGDKATPKAMSVAYRTMLLQALCLPTDDEDPDAQTYERSGRSDSHSASRGRSRTPGEVRADIAKAAAEAGLSPDNIQETWAQNHGGEFIGDATDVAGLEKVLAGLRDLTKGAQR